MFVVNEKKCITCMACIRICPVRAISLKNNVAYIDQKKCIMCGMCKGTCPVKAIDNK